MGSVKDDIQNLKVETDNEARKTYYEKRQRNLSDERLSPRFSTVFRPDQLD
jgi:hypothetical protein